MKYLQAHKKKFSFILNILLLVLFISSIIGFYFHYTQLNKNFLIDFFNAQPTENAIYTKQVYISGAITKPGIYSFEEGEVVNDLVEKAGGFLENSDLAFINEEVNLAEKLKDENKYFIPFKNIAGVKDSNPKGLINLNTATLQELITLPGIGEATANKIIQNRPYNVIEDLLKVNGIGNSKLNNIANLITL